MLNPFCKGGRELLQERVLELSPSRVWQGSDLPSQSLHEGLPSLLAGDRQRKRAASNSEEDILSKRSKASGDPAEGTTPTVEKAESRLGKVKDVRPYERGPCGAGVSCERRFLWGPRRIPPEQGPMVAVLWLVASRYVGSGLSSSCWPYITALFVLIACFRPSSGWKVHR